jgi:hypothetical protein
MFAIELNMFSIGTIVVPTHTKPIFKIECISNLRITKHVQTQFVKLVCFVVVNLIIPLDIVKQHLP